MPGPVILTGARAVAEFAAGTLPPLVEVQDSAVDVSETLNGLQSITHAGQLSAIDLTNSAPIEVKAGQVTTDAQALAKIAGAWQLAVVDTAANVTAALAALETQAKAGRIAEILLSDAGTPSIALSAVQASTWADALALIHGAAHVVVTDTALDVSETLDRLQLIAHAGQLSAIDLTNAAPIEVKAAQITTDAQALAKIAGAWQLAVVDTAANVTAALAALETQARSGRIAEILLTDAGTPSIALSAVQASTWADALALIHGAAHVVVTDTALDVSETLDRLQLIAHAGQLSAIDLTNSAPIEVKAAQITTDAQALAKIAGAWQLAVVDTAANVTAALAALETQAKAGRIAEILLSDARTPSIALSAVQASTWADALALIHGAAHVVVTDTALDVSETLDRLQLIAHAGQLSAIDLTNSAPIEVKAAQITTDAQALAKIAGAWQLAVVVTAANVTAALAALETQAKAGRIAEILLSDAGTPSIALSAVQASTWADALALIHGAAHVVVTDTALDVSETLDRLQLIAHAGQLGAIDLTNSAPIEVKAAQITTDAQALAKIAGAWQLAVVDTAANIGAAFGALRSSASEGRLYGVGLTNPGVAITITEAELKADGAALAKLPSDYTLDVTNVLAADATSIATMAHVSTISVSDTAANVQAHLAELEMLVGTTPDSAMEGRATGAFAFAPDNSGLGTLTGITLTDLGTPVLTLSDSQLTNDGGVLDLISTPFTLDVTGVAAADVASLSSNPLVQSLSVSDTGANITSALSALEAADGAGKISNVVVTSGQANVSDFSDAGFSLYRKFSGANGLVFAVYDVSGESPLDYGNLLAFLQNGPADLGISVPVELLVGGGVILSYNTILSIQNSLNQGFISLAGGSDDQPDSLNTIDLLGINNNQIVDDLFSPSAYVSEYTPVNLTVSQAIQYYSSYIAQVIETQPFDVNSYTATDARLVAGISDNAADLQAGLDSLATALGNQSLTIPIQLTDDLPPTLSVSVTQAVSDATIFNAVTSSYLLSVKGTAEQLNGIDLSGLTNQKIELDFTSLDENITLNGANVYDVDLAGLAVTGGATVSAWSSGGQTGAQISLTGTDGDPHTITLIGANPASLTLYAPLDNGTTLGEGSQLTGILAADAETDAAYTDVASITVADTAANITANLNQLEEVFKAGKLTGVSLTDLGTPVLTLSDSQLTNDGGVLDLISTPFTLDVTGVAAADVASLSSNPLVQSLSVSDTGANITSALSALEAADGAGKISNVVVTSGQANVSDFSDAGFSLYRKFSGANGLVFAVYDVSGESPLDYGNLLAFLQNGPADLGISVPVELLVGGGVILSYNTILSIQNSLNQGFISLAGGSDDQPNSLNTIDLLGINNNQIVDDLFSPSAYVSEYTPVNLTVSQAIQYYSSYIAQVIETQPFDVNSYTATDARLVAGISDNAADLQAGLDSLATALGNQSLTIPIQLTDDLPPTLSVSVTQAVSDATIFNAVTSSYLLSVKGTAEQLNGIDLSGLTNQKIELDFTSLDENITLNGANVYDVDLAGLAVTGGATVSAWSSGGQTGAQISLTGTDGDPHTITLIGANPASLTLYAPLDNGTTLGEGSQLTGILAADAETDAAYTDVASITVADTAANITANLNQLEEVFKAGKLTGVNVTSGSLGTISEGELFADAGVLQLISNSTPAGSTEVHAKLTSATHSLTSADSSASLASSAHHQFIAAMAALSDGLGTAPDAIHQVSPTLNPLLAAGRCMA